MYLWLINIHGITTQNHLETMKSR